MNERTRLQLQFDELIASNAPTEEIQAVYNKIHGTNIKTEKHDDILPHEYDDDIIKWRYIDKIKVKEIAQTLGYKETQVSSRISLLVQNREDVRIYHEAEQEMKRREKQERDEKIIERLKAGKSVTAIVKELKVARNTVTNIKWREGMYES
ncbi:hypothetical protein HMI01_11090 [Halolactibacillus miurensis]|uniref:Homeodomain-like domain-containing protein n=1 Tax=Halolactibacillus miurensis TaxID=306541 RepID=A0A1I6SH62_9BACI|nr:hypothetical protein [Halolactibacillus miurensis]GEM04121.1 hypothetical protein HMI01_11090 [Halolactibacillus miurensis]SFS76078.1 hypothetical protein SAMN05421668_10934 [Halolactibacillus miurensis]